MALVVKASPNDSTNDLIRKFKKLSALAQIVPSARDRQFHKKKSSIRAAKKIEMERLRRRSRKLKHMKNVSQQALERIKERLS